jgi:hypothetical protein
MLIRDLGGVGLTREVETQRGQLVFVKSDGGDHHFTHQGLLRARLRMFQHPQATSRTALAYGGQGGAMPVLPGLPSSRVIKWIAGATQGAKDNLIIYWAPTVIENYLGTGQTAEFTWQPTSELLSDVFREDVQDHLAWTRPLRAVLARQRSGPPRKERASYEEDWDWGPEVVED